MRAQRVEARAEPHAPLALVQDAALPVLVLAAQLHAPSAAGPETPSINVHSATEPVSAQSASAQVIVQYAMVQESASSATAEWYAFTTSRSMRNG